MSAREGFPHWYRPTPWVAAMGAGLTLALPAAAEEDYERIVRSLRPGAELRRAVKDLEHQLLGDDLRIKGGYGLEYRNYLKFRGREYEVRLRGPIVKRKRGLGLSVEVRF